MAYRPSYDLPVTIKRTGEGYAKLEAAKPNAPADKVFQSNEGLEIFNVLKANKLPLANASFWLAGVTPEIDKIAKNGNTYAHAYTATQMQAFVPLSYALKRNRFGQPVLWLYANEYKPVVRGKATTSSVVKRTLSEVSLKRAAK